MSQTKAQLIDPVDGSLVNADINASAAIAGTKISPDFGSQTISTTGTTNLGNTFFSGGADGTLGKLTLALGNASNKIATIQGTSSSTNEKGIAFKTFSFNAKDALTLTPAGLVGLGTTSPSRRLVVTGDTNTVVSVTGATDGTSSLFLGDTDDDDIGALTYNHVSNFLSFTTNASERMRINSSGSFLVGTTSDSIYNDTSGGGFNLKANGQLVLAKEATSASDALVWLNDTGQTTNKSIVFAQEGSEKANIGLAGNDATITVNGSERVRIDSSGNVGIGTTSPRNKIEIKGANAGYSLRFDAEAQFPKFLSSDNTGSTSGGFRFSVDNGSTEAERMRIDNNGRVMIGTTTAVGTNTPNLQVKAASPASGFDNHIYLEGSETNGNANTGATIGFGGHDGTTARNWAQIAGFKTNGSSGNTSSFLSFRTRRSGVSGINEMWKITAMGSLLARDDKESAIGREFTNGNVPAGQTRDHTDNGRLNFNSIGGNGGGHITCLSISSQDQNPSGAMIIAGVHGQGFNSYDTILSNFDSGISVTFTGGTVSIQNTSSETIYYSVNVIHMGTGNTTYLGR